MICSHVISHQRIYISFLDVFFTTYVIFSSSNGCRALWAHEAWQWHWFWGLLLQLSILLLALPTLQNSSFVHSMGSVNSLPFPSYSSLVPPCPLPFPYDFPISFVLHHDQPPQVPNQIQVVATHPHQIQVVMHCLVEIELAPRSAESIINDDPTPPPRPLHSFLPHWQQCSFNPIFCCRSCWGVFRFGVMSNLCYCCQYIWNGGFGMSRMVSQQ